MGTRMQQTEQAVTGIFASTDPQPTPDTGGQTVQKLSGIWGSAAGDAASSRQASTGFSPDAFDFKAMEAADTEIYVDHISSDPEGALGQVDSIAADMDPHVFEVQYQSAADDAASSLGCSMGF